MKKVLLLSLVLLCAVSLSAATQTLGFKKATVQNTLVKKATATFSKNKAVKCAAFAAPSVQSPRLAANRAAAKRVVRRLPGLTDLTGGYVEDTPGTNDGVEYSTMCCSVDIKDTLAVDEETGAEYNVIIRGLCQGIAEVLGQYDPEDGTISIPMQYCYYEPDDPEVQLAYIAAVTEITPEGQYNLGEVLVLRVEEDENGFYVFMDPDYQIGWCIVCEEGDPNYAGYIISSNDDLVLNPANYETTYSTIDVTLPREEQDWEDFQSHVFVEDLGDEIIVHGFCGQFCNSLTLKEDGSLAFRTGQNVYYSRADGAWLSFFTFGDDGYLLCSDTYECPIVIGQESKIIYYGGVNEDGTIDWNYLCIGYYDKTDPNPEGLWTGVEFAGIKLIPLAYYIEGVNTVLAPTATSKGNFNLQGQRVNSLNKGVNVWNGKKYLVK